MIELNQNQINDVNGGIWGNVAGAVLGAAGAGLGALDSGASGGAVIASIAGGFVAGGFSPVSGFRSFAINLGGSYGGSRISNEVAIALE
ncbi:hypothetical protein [Pseudoalteromonas phenolica]|uniref:hypothetical protein n=1 Tax=Pseudoalteromonas phenolica TaxID=161398 RepID=UPI00110AB8F8|nr:hypothetical protein [Pseudoalteromonas phenolica]TMO58041.1 hypothetical protein CWC21_01960 [Pseudoalteromonas phenolica]